MKQLTKLVKLMILCSLLFLTVKDSYSFDKNETNLYVGIDSQFCKMCFSKECGGTLFGKKSFGFNQNVGIYLSENSMIEIGYQYLKSSRISNFSSGEIFHVIMVPNAIGSVTFKSSYSMKSPYISFGVITSKYDDIPIRLFASAGLSHSTAKFSRKTLQIGDFQGSVSREFEKTKTLMRFSVGSMYEMTKKVSIKCFATFLNTGKLNANTNDGINSTVQYKILPKNMVCYGIGLMYNF